MEWYICLQYDYCLFEYPIKGDNFWCIIDWLFFVLLFFFFFYFFVFQFEVSISATIYSSKT